MQSIHRRVSLATGPGTIMAVLFCLAIGTGVVRAEGPSQWAIYSSFLGNCLRTITLPINPFWNKRDFCSVGESQVYRVSVAGDHGYHFLRDVSIQSGIQHDLVDMLKYAAHNMPPAGHGGISEERLQLRRTLDQCVESYITNIGADECIVDPAHAIRARFSRTAKTRSGRIRIRVGEMISIVKGMH